MKDIYVHFIIFLYNVYLGWDLEQFFKLMYTFLCFF